MSYINDEGGQFITVLPKTRKENSYFEQWYRSHKVQWDALVRKPDHRRPESAEHIYWGYESAMPSEEGYRIIWILSSQKQEQDARTRQRNIEKTIKALDTLKGKVGTRKWKSKAQIEDAANGVFAKYRSGQWFDWKMVLKQIETYKQKGKGRPGKNTEYVRNVLDTWTFEAMPNGIKIKEEALFDGIFPLITNIEAKELSMKEVLLKYKFQPYIEKRHQQFKSAFEAAPVFLKLPHRIEALKFVYFIVLLLNALIERELRLAMGREEMPSLPLYPEQRECHYPTAIRIIDLFSDQRRHILFSDGRKVKSFYDPLSDLQIKILELLNVSKRDYDSE